MSPSTRTDRFTLLLVCCALIGAPLALGAVHTPVVIAVWFVLVAAFLLGFRSSRSDEVNPRYSPLSLAMLLAATTAIVQIIPLPPGLLSLLGSVSHETFQASWLAAHGGEVPDVWRPISLDPMRTADRAMRFCALFLATAVIGNLPDRNRAWKWISGAVLAGATLSLAIGLIHRAANLTLFYGFHEAIVGPKLSTFISSNHAGSFFGIASITAFGLAFRATQLQKPQPAVAAAIGAFVLFIASMDSDSAGATLVFIAAALLFAFMMARRHLPTRLVTGLTTATLVATGLVVATWDYLVTTGLGQWLFHSAGVRSELTRAALSASKDFWFLGSGAGSVDRVLYPYVQWETVGPASIPTIENELAEHFLTLGWPVAITFILLLLATFTAVRPPSSEDESERHKFHRALLAASLLYLFGVGSMHFPFLALGVSLPLLAVAECSLRQLYQRRGNNNRGPSVRYPFVSASPLKSRLLGGTAILMFASAVAGWIAYEVPEDALAETTTPAEVDRLLKLVPSESQIFVHLVRKDAENEDWKSALERANRAFALEPTSRFQLYLAYLNLQAGNTGESIALYQKLGTTHLASRVALDAATYLEEPGQIAEATKTMDPRGWRLASVQVQKLRGHQANTDFALALVELHPQVPEAFRLVISSFWTTKNFQVAEAWARLMILRELPGEISGYGFWIASLEKQKLRKKAQELAFKAYTLAPHDPDVQRSVLRLKSVDFNQSSREEVKTVESAMERICRPPMSTPQRTQCALTRGWIAEAKGDAKEAQKAFELVFRSFKNPKPLAEFYARNGQCVSIRKLGATLKPADSANKASLEKTYARCAAN